MSRDIHTCHADCPCHRGEQPAPDFLGANEISAEALPESDPDEGRVEVSLTKTEARSMIEGFKDRHYSTGWNKFRAVLTALEGEERSSAEGIVGGSSLDGEVPK